MSPEENSTAWCQEYTVGRAFAAEGDYYRATTCFHRARHLLSTDASSSPERRAQIVRALILTYSLAGKPQEAVDVWEKELDKVLFSNKELAEDTISLLFEDYHLLKREVDAEKIFSSLPPQNVLRDKLSLFREIASESARLPFSEQPATKLGLQKEVEEATFQFNNAMKSPFNAALYNALLPGAGYFYVGQYKAAATALLMNALFTTATVQFFAVHLPAAAILSGGFELGWYGGGIMGAKLAAEIYNQHLREIILKPLLEKHSLFPLQTMHYTW
jgi:tetratricopeptide (TPR) repeat protein